MRAYRNPSLDPAYNQALEEYFFGHFEGDEPLLLLWRNRPAVVCGCYQNLYGEVNLPLALEKGIRPVRRITGGGTVYHDEGNLNYTVIAPAERLGASYDPCLSLMLDALHDLGIPAEKGRTCDLSLAGVKISGSAQKISGGVLLHHGTLLYDADLAAMHGVLSPRGAYQSKAIPSSPFPTGNIRALCGLSYTAEQFSAILAERFFRDCAPVSLSEKAKKEIEGLAAEKYRSFDWTYARSPRFSLKTVLQGDGRSVSVKVEKGILREGEGIPQDWIGKKLDPSSEPSIFFSLL